ARGGTRATRRPTSANATSKRASARRSRCWRTSRRRSRRCRRDRSDAQRLEKGHALLRRFEIQLDEVIPDAAGLRRGECLSPLDRALAERGGGAGRRVPVLKVHRVEPALILREVLGGVEALRDRRHLELKLHQRGIEQAEEDVVGALSIDRRRLEPLVVQPLLDAAFLPSAAHTVLFSPPP